MPETGERAGIGRRAVLTGAMSWPGAARGTLWAGAARAALWAGAARAALWGSAAHAVLWAGAAHAATPLRIGYEPVLGAASLGVIDGMGWASDAGLRLKPIRFEAGADASKALAAGQLEACFTSAVSVLVARAATPSMRIVAAAGIEEVSIVLGGSFAGQYSQHGLKAAIDSFVTILGRKPRFGTQPPGSAHDLILRYWLETRNGVDPASVEFVAATPGAIRDRFAAGTMDGAVVQEPGSSFLRSLQPDVVVAASSRQILPDLPGTVLAVAAAQPAWLDPLLRLHVRATALLATPLSPVATPVWRLLAGNVIPLTVIERSILANLRHFVADPARIADPLAKLAGYGVPGGGAADAIDASAFRRVSG